MRYFLPVILALMTFLTPSRAAIPAVQVEIYTIPGCMGCDSAKSLLDEKGIPYQEISLQGNRVRYAEMKARAGGRQDESMTVPRIFINGKHIGGYSDLRNMDLDNLMGKEKTDS
jgi:glutaredoxin 3